MQSAARVGMDFGSWDKGFDITGWVNPVSRTLKENANVVIFNAWENLADIKRVCADNHIVIKRCLVLSKSNPAPFNKDRMFVNDVEFALWGVYSHNDKPTGWVFNRQDPVEKCVMNTTVQSSKLHPTMKDIKIIKKLVALLSNEGDIVLDPFMGSGTTGVACKLLNRNFIGIELDENYFNIAKKRIEETDVD
jgi:DNA modification methylase